MIGHGHFYFSEQTALPPWWDTGFFELIFLKHWPRGVVEPTAPRGMRATKGSFDHLVARKPLSKFRGLTFYYVEFLH